jgi:hypothetical protein
MIELTRLVTEVSVFSVQVSAFMFLFPDTRHLTPDPPPAEHLTTKTLRFGAWNLIFYNAPPLHHPSRLLHEGKTSKAPSGVGSKPGPQGTWILYMAGTARQFAGSKHQENEP